MVEKEEDFELCAISALLEEEEVVSAAFVGSSSSGAKFVGTFYSFPFIPFPLWNPFTFRESRRVANSNGDRKKFPTSSLLFSGVESYRRHCKGLPRGCQPHSHVRKITDPAEKQPPLPSREQPPVACNNITFVDFFPAFSSPPPTLFRPLLSPSYSRESRGGEKKMKRGRREKERGNFFIPIPPFPFSEGKF